MSNDARLGTALLEAGHITEEQLALAVDDHLESGKELSRVVVEQGLVDTEVVIAMIAAETGFEPIDLDVEPIDPAAVALIPETLLRRYTVVPITSVAGHLVVAMADPANVLAIDDLRAVTGMPITTGCCGGRHRGRDQTSIQLRRVRERPCRACGRRKRGGRRLSA